MSDAERNIRAARAEATGGQHRAGLVRALQASYDAVARGELDGVLAALHPDVEHVIVGDFPDGGYYRGRAAVRRLWEEMFEDVTEWRFEVEEVLVAGDVVVVLVRESFTGRRSGARVDWRIAHVYTFRDGLVVRFEGYRDREKALRALRHHGRSQRP